MFYFSSAANNRVVELYIPTRPSSTSHAAPCGGQAAGAAMKQQNGDYVEWVFIFFPLLFVCIDVSRTLLDIYVMYFVCLFIFCVILCYILFVFELSKSS